MLYHETFLGVVNVITRINYLKFIFSIDVQSSRSGLDEAAKCQRRWDEMKIIRRLVGWCPSAKFLKHFGTVEYFHSGRN